MPSVLLSPINSPEKQDMQTTQWFEGGERPVRSGVYERLAHASSILYSHWNGLYWGGLGSTAEQCLIVKDQRSEWQDLPWRGLADT